MRHYRHRLFRRFYRELPAEVRILAKRNYALLKANPSHPSLNFKPVGFFWSARVGKNWRALARKVGDDYVWWWIGPHAKYDWRKRGK